MPTNARTKRILLALAALHLKVEEVSDFMSLTRDSSPMQILDWLRQIERDVLPLSDSAQEKRNNFLNVTDKEVVKRILIMLRTEARLTNDDIADGLTGLLIKENEMLPGLIPKKSIAEWLSVVSRIVGPSKLLQAATMLRNQRVHQKRTPWTLDR